MRKNKNIIIIAILIIISVLLIGIGIIYIFQNNNNKTNNSPSQSIDKLNDNNSNGDIKQENVELSLGDVSGLSNSNIEKKVNDIFGNEHSKYIIKNANEKGIIFSNVDSNGIDLNIECNYTFEVNEFICYNTMPSDAIKTG